MEAELSKVKLEKAALKKAVLKERQEKTFLTKRLEELEIKNKRKSEEIDALHFSNLQLIKKCENLQTELQEKNSSWGFSWWKTSYTVKLEDAQAQIKVLQEELQSKIQENEHVHVTNFEIKQKYKTQKADLREQLNSRNQMLRDANSQIEELSGNLNYLKTQMYETLKENQNLKKALEEKHTQLQQTIKTTQSQKENFESQIKLLKQKIKRSISLDSEGYEYLDYYNYPQFNITEITEKNLCLKKFQSFLNKALSVALELLEKYSVRLSYLFEGTSSEFQQIVKEIKNKTPVVSKNLKSLVESLETLSLKDLLGNFNEFMVSLKSYLHFVMIQLSNEADYIENKTEVQNLNNSLCEAYKNLYELLSPLLNYSSVQLLYPECEPVKEFTESFLDKFSELSKLWGRRLSLDLHLHYTLQVKSTKTLNEELQNCFSCLEAEFINIYSVFSKTENSLYYNLSPFYQSSCEYLQSLRNTHYEPGINYYTSLSNSKQLKESEQRLDEQRLEILGLKKELKESFEETKHCREKVVALENEMAAIEHNIGLKEDTQGRQLVEDPESLSENVSNGVQRLAVRLIDSQGQPVPVSELQIQNDVYNKLRSSALAKINQLSGQLKQ